MNVGSFLNVRGRVVTLVIAASLAIAAIYTPILLDEIGSGNFVDSALAGDTSSSDGGG